MISVYMCPDHADLASVLGVVTPFMVVRHYAGSGVFSLGVPSAGLAIDGELVAEVYVQE